MTAAVLVVDGQLHIETSRELDLLVLSADLRTGDGAYLSVRAARGTTVVRPPLDLPHAAVEVVDAVSGVVYARLDAREG